MIALGLLTPGCGDDRVIMDDFPAGVAVVHGEVTAPDGSPLADAESGSLPDSVRVDLTLPGGG